MKAVVFHGIGDIRLETVRDPKIKEPTDALIRITASAICGTDLHFVRGTLSGLEPGATLGHEAVGVIEEVGRDVRNFKIGDRVVVPSTICCGYCSYCRAGYQSQCDVAHPKGPHAGTPYYGGGEQGGGFDGLQAEYARIAYAAANLVRLPDGVSNDQAILLSDIFPTAYFGADLAEIKPGDTVVVFGCGPVGQFAIASAKLHGAGRVFAVDCVASRLEMARDQGAEAIDFNREDPVEVLQRMTGGIGPDRAIDAVGLDAMAPSAGPAAKEAKKHRAEFRKELKELEPEANLRGKQWRAGDAPSQVLQWAVESLAKAGTLSIVGLYPEGRLFPIGEALDKNLTIKAGNTPHRKYIPELVDLVESGVVDPAEVLTQTEPLTDAIEAYKAFDLRQPGWVKVELKPTPKERKAA
ncbi:MAG TPA: zinc-dependent alcohol dehydrogenase [Burkholderiales bacterium]|nr:zinc-dependent alcohol dehydrogenase [Burkholderiales bacterium]